ncbi:murein hydrolase activator EnvC family protein [Roseibium aquae]|nr:M23 family metallopeptidase [Roseibium aquae]
MRTLRSDLMTKVALVTLIGGVLAGCSNAVERFGEAPIYTGGTGNQRAILGGEASQPSYDDIVNGTGGTVAGLPPASSAPVSTGSIRTPAPQRTIQSQPLPAMQGVPQPGAVLAAPAAVVSAPVVPAGAAQPVSWKGWTSTGGTRIAARSGDSVDKIARRYGVPAQAVARVNGLPDNAPLQPGQSIIIPTYVYGAQDTPARQSVSAAQPVALPAASGPVPQSTGSIAATSQSGVPQRKPARQPSFAEISAGQVAASSPEPIRVSAAPRTKPVTLPSASGQMPQTTASISSPASPPIPDRQPVRTVSTSQPAPASGPSATPNPAGSSMPEQTPQVVAAVQPEEVSASATQFRWPVRGRIISEFGAKPGGGHNEGINLAVPEGTPVLAAAPGTVIYSGNELQGYGNLVLLRHDDGWVSAYAHNSELKVKRGDTVRRGDVVGLAGATGSVTTPQVHFELRRGNKPVDPLKYLPRG